MAIGDVAGKKGKTMERRILKDFHIGIVEGIVSEMKKHPKETKNVFGHIAKAIGRRASLKGKKKDWNSLVRNKTTDPIGTSQEAENLRERRQSLRKYILTNIDEPENIDREKLVEYNPNLTAYSNTTKLAYAKFMTKKISKDFKNEEQSSTEGENAVQPTTLRRESTKHSVKFASPTPVTAAKVVSKLDQGEINKKDPVPADSSTKDAPPPEEKQKDKSVTEENQTPLITLEPLPETREPPATSERKEPPTISDSKKTPVANECKQPPTRTETKEPSKSSETKEPSKPSETKESSKPSETKEPSKPSETKDPPKPSETKQQSTASESKQPAPKPPELLVTIEDETKPKAAPEPTLPPPPKPSKDGRSRVTGGFKSNWL